MFKTRTRIWWQTAVLFAIISVIGLCAHAFGWYQEFWYMDIILHTLSGVMFGLFWLGLTYKEKIESNFISLLTITMAGVFGSFLWELWEFGGAYILPGIAIAYTPDLADSLGDIACGMGGAFVLAVMNWLISTRR
jgi:hypothetical protein